MLQLVAAPRAHGLGHVGKPVTLQERVEATRGLAHQRQPVIDMGRALPHGRGPRADPGMGIGGRVDAAQADQRHLAARQL